MDEPQLSALSIFILAVVFLPGGLSGIPRLLRREQKSAEASLPLAGGEL